MVSKGKNGASKEKGGSGGGEWDDDDPALVLARDLLPYLPKKVSCRTLVPALLGAARTSSSSSSLALLHAVATARWKKSASAIAESNGEEEGHGVDGLFAAEAAEYCPTVSAEVRGSLWDVCLLSADELKSDGSSEERLARVGYASRCVPFLVRLECGGNRNTDEDEDSDEDMDEEDESEDEGDDDASLEAIGRVRKWFASTLKQLEAKDTSYDSDNDDGSPRDITAVRALLLESLAASAMECRKSSSDKTKKLAASLQKALIKSKPRAAKLVFAHPRSSWAVRGVAAIVGALGSLNEDANDNSKAATALDDRSNEAFEGLVSQLVFREMDRFSS